MLVNSIIFWIFFTIFLIPYFSVLKDIKFGQNIWLLVGSYFFYGWADWRMIPLLLLVTIIFYYLGIFIEKFNHTKPIIASRLTTIGVLCGIVILIYFKYLGFMVEEFSKLLEQCGLHTSIQTFKIIMPIGISFFTFKLISYVIEIHRENINPTYDFISFATFIAFFPTIMSGPIDRPNLFLPQLNKPRKFNYNGVSEGSKRILWGMFLKICIANRLSPYTDAIFNNCSHHSTTSFIFASILYFIQMYADFCGYSHMAIGTAQVLGLKVVENFNRPFFAKNMAEYWRRWHMSLTTWITDYIFMPLNIAMRNWGKWGLYLATLINLVVIGVWHGANWTYLVFGLYHGILMVIVSAAEKKRKTFEKAHNLKKNELYIWSRRIITFMFCTFGAMLFRANSIQDIFTIVCSPINGWGKLYTDGTLDIATFGVLSIILLLLKEYKDEYKKDLHFLHSSNTLIKFTTIVLLMCLILLTGELSGESFIYFQF